MRRRTLLSAATAAAATAISGCAAQRPEPIGPSGEAHARPLDEPFMQGGMTAETDRYVYARLYHPDDSLQSVEGEWGDWLSDAVDGLESGQFGLLTNLRTAAAAPAYLWPTEATFADGSLRITLGREEFADAGIETAEAVGVAFAIYGFEGDPPQSADIVLPSGATLSLG